VVLEENISDANPLEQKPMAVAKPPPFLYLHDIVDTFNNAGVFEAAIEPSVVQKLTKFTEYRDCNKVVTTTCLFNPFHREEIEDKLNIKIAEKGGIEKTH
jgi:hypothetical protein